MLQQFTKMFRGSGNMMNAARKIQPKRGLEEFIDKTVLEGKPLETSGRAWSVREIRNKSLSDLQKLWIVLMKERNMLLTCRLLAKSMGGRMTHPERLVKVRTSMARIKQIIAERERDAKEVALLEFEKRKASNYYDFPQTNPLGLQLSTEEVSPSETTSTSTPSQ